jgi:hypothetical protein
MTLSKSVEIFQGRRRFLRVQVEEQCQAGVEGQSPLNIQAHKKSTLKISKGRRIIEGRRRTNKICLGVGKRSDHHHI